MKSGRGKSCGKLWKAPRRNRLISVAHSKQAALGFRVHSGWAALVAVRLEKSAPVVLVRQRAHLVETFTYEFRQPFHTAGKMPISQARDFIERVRDKAQRLAHRAIHELQSDLQKQGMALKSCGLLLASGKALPNLEKIHCRLTNSTKPSASLLHASRRCGLQARAIKERELLEQAVQAFHLKPAELMRRVTELGRALGAPWSKDEKLATLAAWLALRASLKGGGRTLSGGAA